MCQMVNCPIQDAYLYHEKPPIFRGEMGNGPLRDRALEGSGFTSPLRETDHDLDSASLDRYPETMFPAFDDDREVRLTSCRDGPGAR